MKIVIRVYSLVLLGYTGWRTYDFMRSQLPDGNLSVWMSLIFLFCTEIGLVLWHETRLSHVTTDAQDNIALAMTWIDFVGSLGAGVADMMLRQTLVQGYVIPPFLVDFLIYGLPIIMAANVAAVIFFETNDADSQKRKAEKALLFQAHRDAMADIANSREAFSAQQRKIITERVTAGAANKVRRLPAPGANTANNGAESANNGVGESANNGKKSANNGHAIANNVEHKSKRAMTRRFFNGESANNANPTIRRRG